jgi:hypothetical protein
MYFLEFLISENELLKLLETLNNSKIFENYKWKDTEDI